MAMMCPTGMRHHRAWLVPVEGRTKAWAFRRRGSVVVLAGLGCRLHDGGDECRPARRTAPRRGTVRLAARRRRLGRRDPGTLAYAPAALRPVGGSPGRGR